jgi:hypothetical protein
MSDRLSDEVYAMDLAVAEAEAVERTAHCRVRALRRLYDDARAWFDRMHPMDAEKFHRALKEAEDEAIEAHRHAAAVVRLLKSVNRERPFPMSIIEHAVRYSGV